MNDKNMEEDSRYFSLSKCHYVIDKHFHVIDIWDRYPEKQWRQIISYPFLDQENSPYPLFRAFYIPVLSQRANGWGNYYVLKASKS